MNGVAGSGFRAHSYPVNHSLGYLIPRHLLGFLPFHNWAGSRDTAFASVTRLNLRHAVDGTLGIDEASRIRERNATCWDESAARQATSHGRCYRCRPYPDFSNSMLGLLAAKLPSVCASRPTSDPAIYRRFACHFLPTESELRFRLKPSASGRDQGRAARKTVVSALPSRCLVYSISVSFSGTEGDLR
jgi:hypothetical protein